MANSIPLVGGKTWSMILLCGKALKFLIYIFSMVDLKYSVVMAPFNFGCTRFKKTLFISSLIIIVDNSFSNV